MSVLGLVLMAASAVTAAIIPSKSDDENFVQPGSLTASTVASGTPKNTCVVTAGAITAPCNVTLNSGTTGGVKASSDLNNSNSTAGAGDIDG